MSEFNSLSSLDDELLEDDEPPPPPPPAFFAPATLVVVEVLEVELEAAPLDAEFDEPAVLPLSVFADDALPFTPLVPVLVEVCALAPVFEAAALPVPLP